MIRAILFGAFVGCFIGAFIFALKCEDEEPRHRLEIICKWEFPKLEERDLK